MYRSLETACSRCKVTADVRLTDLASGNHTVGAPKDWMFRETTDSEGYAVDSFFLCNKCYREYKDVEEKFFETFCKNKK